MKMVVKKTASVGMTMGWLYELLRDVEADTIANFHSVYFGRLL